MNYYYLCFWVAWATFGFSCQSPSVSPPNVLIILADDMGYGDLGVYGGTARTPHLDSLAAQGVRFTNCYAGAPNCSPSRVSLLTGRIPARAGMYSYRPPNHPMHLPDAEITLAEQLKAVGYQTAHIGKWHLGCLPQDETLNHPQPDQQGFDYSLGTANNAQPSHLNPTNFVRNGTPLGEQQGYACQLLADEVETWFDQHYDAARPFFLYLPFHEPHAKIASPPELIAHYPDHDDKAAAYFANIENLDSAIGRVFRLIKDKGVGDNTLVVFISDNGSYRMGSNGSLRGLKGEIYDGGMKVPGIMSFPGRIPGNRVLDTPIWFQDIFPTVCGLTGATMPTDRPMDGVDLWPLLTQGEEIQRAHPMLWYFYRSDPELSMRMGDYSLVSRVQDSLPRTHWIADRDMPFIKSLYPTQFEVYNLDADPNQQQDLAATQPALLDSLQRIFKPFFQTIQQEGPVWEGLPAYDSARANHLKPKEYLRNQRRFLPQ